MDSKANDKFPQKTEDPEEKDGRADGGRGWKDMAAPEAGRDKEDILFPRTRREIEAQPTP